MSKKRVKELQSRASEWEKGLSFEEQREFYLEGITLPERPGMGRMPKRLQHAWVGVVLQLMARGIRYPRMIARLTGLKETTAKSYLAKAEAALETLPQSSTVVRRREKLWREAEEVASFAWRSAMETSSPRERAALLKIVLQANGRRAALFGLDTKHVEVEVEQHIEVDGDVVARVSHEFGVSPEQLAAIGRLAAQAISDQRLRELQADGRVIEARPIEPSRALPAPQPSVADGLDPEIASVATEEDLAAAMAVLDDKRSKS